MSKFLHPVSAGSLAAVAAASLLLAGCDRSKEPAPAPSDPAMTGALGDDIMVDPEMAGQDGAAVSADDKAITLPPADRSPEAIADARKKAAKLAGGALKPAPRPRDGGINVLTETAATAAQVAKASKLARTDCTTKLDFSNTWAAKLPADLPVYPRGAVQEAAGVARDGCAMIVVNYGTPVSPQDVISFYYSMAARAGYSAQYRTSAGQYAIGGRKGDAAYVVYASKSGPGVTEVNLVTTGK